jgi:hypothetical protein
MEDISRVEYGNNSVQDISSIDYKDNKSEDMGSDEEVTESEDLV